MRHLIIIYLSIFTCIGLNAQDKEEVVVDSLSIKRIDSLNTIVKAEFYKRNYDKTIEIGEMALELSFNSNYFGHYSYISSFMGNAYLEIDDTLVAKKIFSKSIELAKEKKDYDWQTIAEIDLANFYALRKDNNSRRKAIELYKEILEFDDIQKDNERLVILNSNIAEMYLKLELPMEAEKYILNSKKYFDKNTFLGFKGSYALNKGDYNYQTNNFDQAKIDLQEGLEIFNKIDYLDGKIQVYITLVKIALAEKNYEEAYRTEKKLDALEKEKFEVDKIEAIQTVTTKLKVAEMAEQLKEEKKLSEIKEAQAKQETRFQWIKIAAGILLIFSIILFISYLKRRRLVKHLIRKNKQYLEEKEKSEELMKAKSVLFSNITHELRTPMYGIIGISNILSDNDLFKSEQKSLKSLKFSAEYLLSLVNNILHFNKIESNEVDLVKISEFDIRNIVYNVVESSKFLSEDHPNTYEIKIDHSIPNILKGDVTKISQILINLLGNASKFTNDGNIEVCLEEQSRTKEDVTIAFTIKDSGVGIDKGILKTIYNKYAQTGSGQHFMGTGLGLPIVKKLIEQLGGTLTLNSTVGQGTTVTFAIKFKIAKSTILDEISTTELQTVLNNLNILVVDDNKINQLVTKKFIERHGGTGVTVGSGQEAIDIVKDKKFDIILMDINMPEMNGFEATQAIRDFNNNIPIIALTAVEKEKVVGDHYFNLMNDIIIKPYSNEEFLNTLLSSVPAVIT